VSWELKVSKRHSWNVSAAEAREIQKDLRTRVKIGNGFKKVRLVGGADVSFKKGKGCAVCIVMRFPELETVEEVMVKGEIRFPYIPGLLTFREGPLLLRAFSRLREIPDVILFDGQGIAHPLGLGLAAHMGVLLGKPTLGCAKSRLVGDYREPGLERGSVSVLTYKGRRVGSVLRTRTNVRPVFVSPGHLVGFGSSVRLVLECGRGYRIPEPTRLADISCGKGMESG